VKTIQVAPPSELLPLEAEAALGRQAAEEVRDACAEMTVDH